MQKFRADAKTYQSDEAILWHSNWFGGPTLAKIEQCRIESLQGEIRRTVYITGNADTYFSIPAVCRIQGCRVKGYVTCDQQNNLVFHHCYY